MRLQAPCLRHEGLAVFALPDFRRLFHGCSQLPDTAPAVLCLLLKVGIRTLQRYRAIGVLPYFTISGKVFYRTKDVHEFIRTRFAEVEERAAKRKEKEARKAERRRKRGLFP